MIKNTENLFKISTRNMMVNKGLKEMTCEASDIGGFQLGQIYDDACDVGINVESHRTGLVATFYLSDERCDADNEVRYWEFKPCKDDPVVRTNRMEDWSIVIFND